MVRFEVIAEAKRRLGEAAKGVTSLLTWVCNNPNQLRVKSMTCHRLVTLSCAVASAAATAVAWFVLPLPVGSAGLPAIVVMTDKGAVRGTEAGGVRVFKGIPYASPPVGDRRWALPEEHKRWSGTLNATAFGSGCPQVSRYHQTEAGYDEDCLFVNVTVPKAPLSQKLAVLVWIYGGAFVGGSSSLYPLTHLATMGRLIVVSMNYRLGALGFMAHPAFDRATDGDYGQADQRAALRWVQRNIAAFGGDPHNVTIAGESAGAASVCMQMLAPVAAKGLFQKAIVQSAGCVQHLRTIDESNLLGLKIARAIGCSGRTPATLTCMRSKSVKTLVETAAKEGGNDVMSFAPSVGTTSVPLQGEEAMRSGRFIKVPMINGGDQNELRLYVAYAAMLGQHVTDANYAAALKVTYDDKTPQVLAEYPYSDFSSPSSALGSVMSDFSPKNGLNNCLYQQTAHLASKHVAVYEYEFTDSDAPPVTPNPGFEMGAVHSSELPYQFPGFDNTSKAAGPPLSAGAELLSEKMIAYWTAFARTGTPAAPNQIAWIPFQSSTAVLRLNQKKAAYFDAGAIHHCAFWQKLYPRLLNR
jgi:para-nitrobenzyl esterase